MLAFNNWTNVVCLVSINPTYRQLLSSGLNISTWTTLIIVTYLDQEEKVSTFRFFSFFSYEMTEHRRTSESLWKERKTTVCHSSHRCRRRRLRFVSYIFLTFSRRYPSTMFCADIWMNRRENELFFFFRSYIMVIDCVNKNTSSASISLWVWREEEDEEVTEKKTLKCNIE
jgi:hypothetical protein